MARVRFFEPADMEAGWGPDLPEFFARVGSDRLVLNADGVRLVYLGTFELRDGEVVGGTIETVRASVDGARSYRATELSYDLRDYFNLWATEGYLSASTAAFEGDDRISGSDGADMLEGFRGDDVIRGGRGDDTLKGGDGRDVLRGGRGDDLLDGWNGGDRITGGGGDDTLYGWDGSDRLRGGGGDDWLFGDGGDDRLVGGRGFDAFVFDLDDGQDVVADFEAGVDSVGLYDGATVEDVEIDEVGRGTVLRIGELTEVFLRGVFDFDEGDLFVL